MFSSGVACNTDTRHLASVCPQVVTPASQSNLASPHVQFMVRWYYCSGEDDDCTKPYIHQLAWMRLVGIITVHPPTRVP